MRRRALQILTGTLLGLLAVAVAFWVGGRPPAPETDDHILASPLPAPAFTLRAHTGDDVSLETLDAELVVVFFGYTHCPDVCPATMATLSRAVDAMGAAGERVTALLVTVDPARDTVERMAEYMGSFHPSFLGLTGNEEEIRAVTEAWGVFRGMSDEVPAHEKHEGYLVDHTARSFVVRPGDGIVATFPAGTGPDAVAGTLDRLLHGS